MGKCQAGYDQMESDQGRENTFNNSRSLDAFSEDGTHPKIAFKRWYFKNMFTIYSIHLDQFCLHSLLFLTDSYNHMIQWSPTPVRSPVPGHSPFRTGQQKWWMVEHRQSCICESGITHTQRDHSPRLLVHRARKIGDRWFNSNIWEISSLI